ncbi:MAG: CDP-archaeol synthase [Patescibacteria group bacterium]
MLQFITQSLSLVLPIFIAGVCFIFILSRDYLSFLNSPIDFGTKIRKKRLFGDNKTWRGVIIYIVFGVLTSYILNIFVQSGARDWAHPVFINEPLFVGVAFALSYVLGELINSFFKRQAGIAPGMLTTSKIQLIVDNVDGMALTAIVLVFVLGVWVWNVLLALAIGFVLHCMTEIFMRKIGLKRKQNNCR